MVLLFAGVNRTNHVTMNTSTNSPWTARLFLIAAALNISTLSNAQAPGLIQFVLESEIGQAQKAIRDSLYNIFIAARWEDFAVNASGIQVVKYDTDGVAVWDNLLGLTTGVGGFLVNDMTITSDGGLALIGDHVGGPPADSAFVIKVDVDGAFDWAVRVASNLPGTFSTRGRSIAEGPNGVLYVGLETTHLSTALQRDGLIAKISAMGNVLQTVRLERPDPGTFTTIGKIATEPGGGFVLSGRTGDTGGGSWITKFNGSLDVIWSTRFETDDLDVDPIMLFCVLEGFDMFLTSPFPTNQAPLYKVSADGTGNFQSARRYEVGGAYGNFRDGTILADHSHAIAGQFELKSGDKDAALIKLDNTGEPEWGMLYGTNGDEEAVDVAPQANGGFTVVGSGQRDSLVAAAGGLLTQTYVMRPDADGFTGGCEQPLTVTSDPLNIASSAFVLNTSPMDGIWVPADFTESSVYAEEAVCAVLSVRDPKRENLCLFPNPVTDRLRLNIHNGRFQWTIFDMHGGEVLQGNSSSSNTIKVADLHPGIYVLKVIGDRYNGTARFTKE